MFDPTSTGGARDHQRKLVIKHVKSTSVFEFVFSVCECRPVTNESLVFMSCCLMLHLADHGCLFRTHFARMTRVSLEDGDLSHL